MSDETAPKSPRKTASKAPSERTRARRLHHKAAYDRPTIEAILDAMPVAHVAYLLNGAPVVTPTLQWREGDRIYWHGSAASRMQKTARGTPVCVTVTLTDGMVLARSGFEHSVNFRSVMVFGDAVEVTDPTAKAAHLKAMMDQMFPGRWETLRPMTTQELKATAILSLPLDEASAKIAADPPQDPEEDVNFPVWAGVLPIHLTMGVPEPAPDLPAGLPVPGYAKDYHFGMPPQTEPPE